MPGPIQQNQVEGLAAALATIPTGQRAGDFTALPVTGPVNGTNLVFTVTTALLPSQLRIEADQLQVRIDTGELQSVATASGIVTITFTAGQAPVSSVVVTPSTISL